ncbi:hypothetical protein [Actinomadura sediminis]|uniref:Uncharacterized protein n=1 Tax=Actinomadura sediminis TaxID=1038904 RepID=A0ABW3EUB2_9ACTN
MLDHVHEVQGAPVEDGALALREGEEPFDQPGDYAETVLYDVFVRSFSWSRSGYPHPWTESFYHFPSASRPDADFPLIGGGTSSGAARRYEHGPAGTRVVEPYAAPLRWYQRNVRVPGTVLGLVTAAGAAGLLRRRTRSLDAGLLWTTGFALLAIPPASTDFDYRYLLPATPLLCTAAVLAWRPRAGHGGPGTPGRTPVPGVRGTRSGRGSVRPGA